MWASNNDQAASVKWLLHRDADVNLKDVYGRTALDYTINQKIKNMLRKKSVEYFYFI